MYTYQEKTIDLIEKSVEKIETLTEENYSIKIGSYTSTRFVEEEVVPIFVEINGKYRFSEETDNDRVFGIHSKCYIFEEDNVKIDDDVFLKLNDLIDKVIEDNTEREAYYERLNNMLEAMVESL